MKIDKVFVSVNARNFAAQSDWWSTLLGRGWDREPMPSCHEWDLAGCVLFQVLDAPDGGATSVALHVDDLAFEVDRLRAAGFELDEPVRVEGFDDLRLVQLTDTEDNPVSLLAGG